MQHRITARFLSKSLLDLNETSSLNSIFFGIARRINTEASLKVLKDLLVIYDIGNNTQANIIAEAEVNLQWIATYSDDVRGFLDDFFRNASSPMATVSSFIIVFGLALNWIMQN
jgi:hypothetical protein